MSGIRFAALAWGALAGTLALATTSAPPSAHDAGTMAERGFTEALRLEATPRALILAANSVAVAAADREALIARASADAHADAFVQWFAASHAQDDEVKAAALRALQSLEPDNGMVWMLSVDSAMQSGDAPGVSAALARMAAATRFDDRFGEFVVEWLQAGDRHPLQRNDVAQAQADLDPDTVPIVRAIAYASALAIPAAQSVLGACRDSAEDDFAHRAHDCSTIGRLLAGKANSLVSRAFGIVLLRIIGDPSLAGFERRFAWLNEFTVRMPDVATDSGHARRFEADWLAVGHEIGVLQRQLVRLGLPLEPPADWQPAARSVAAGAVDQPR